MMPQRNEYFLKLLLWLVPLSLAGWGLFRYAVPQYAHAAYILTPAVTLLLGCAYYPVLRRMPGRSVKALLASFVLSMLFKMLVTAAYVLGYLYIHAEANTPATVSFGVTYVVFYLCLLVFETRWFLRIATDQ